MRDRNPQFVPGEIRRGHDAISRIQKITAGLDVFICGGFAKYACSPRRNPAKAGDIDLYSQTEETFDKACKVFEDAGFSMDRESPAARSYKDTRWKIFGKLELDIQIIRPIKQGEVVLVGTVEEILGNFDFTVSRVAISHSGVLQDIDFEEDEKNRRLHIKAIHCPLAQVFRIAKYSKKGYHCSLSQVLKLFADWDQRDPGYKEALVSLIAKEDPSTDEIEMLERLLHVD